MKSSNVGRMVSNLFKKQSPPEPRIPSSVSWETFTLALAEATGKPIHAFRRIPIDADPVDHVVGVARDHVNMLRPKSSRMNLRLRDHRISPYYARKDKRDGRWVLYAVVKAKSAEIRVLESPELERKIEAFSLSGPLAAQRGIVLVSFPIIVADIYERNGKFYGVIKDFGDNNRPTLGDYNQHGKR